MTATEFIGWIKPATREFDVNTCRQELTALGVVVGPWDMFAAEFVDCKVSEQAFDKLDDLWGKYIWGPSGS